MNLFSGDLYNPETDYSSQLTLKQPYNGKGGGKDTQFWSFGVDENQKGKIISLTGTHTNVVTRVGNFAFVKVESNEDADVQKFAIGSDNTTMISGFVLRTKLKPELNLVMQICPYAMVTNGVVRPHVRLAVYNGSDEQRWVLTPVGYLVSCKTIYGLKLLVKTPGKFHALCVDHASYCRFNRLVHFITQE